MKRIVHKTLSLIAAKCSMMEDLNICTYYKNLGTECHPVMLSRISFFLRRTCSCSLINSLSQIPFLAEPPKDACFKFSPQHKLMFGHV